MRRISRFTRTLSCSDHHCRQWDLSYRSCRCVPPPKSQAQRGYPYWAQRRGQPAMSEKNYRPHALRLGGLAA
jgi:hypothetical protein